ncbi:uncharacterized protein [Symphalangus syndactylus]|uniref:uncharacterized protein isoform X2 n=1 Tax=Symphalangus syndactylus TaxID=9590 RepID=UPI0030069A1B
MKKRKSRLRRPGPQKTLLSWAVNGPESAADARGSAFWVVQFFPYIYRVWELTQRIQLHGNGATSQITGTTQRRGTQKPGVPAKGLIMKKYQTNAN